MSFIPLDEVAMKRNGLIDKHGRPIDSDSEMDNGQDGDHCVEISYGEHVESRSVSKDEISSEESEKLKRRYQKIVEKSENLISKLNFTQECVMNRMGDKGGAIVCDTDGNEVFYEINDNFQRIASNRGEIDHADRGQICLKVDNDCEFADQNNFVAENKAEPHSSDVKIENDAAFKQSEISAFRSLLNKEPNNSKRLNEKKIMGCLKEKDKATIADRKKIVGKMKCTN